MRRNIQLHPKAIRPNRIWGAMLAGLGRYREAREQLRRALRLSPSDPLARFNLALASESLGRYNETEKILRQLINQGHEAALTRPMGAWRFLGTAMLRQGRWHAAAKFFQASLRHRRGVGSLVGRAISMETGDGDRVSGLKLQHDLDQIRYISRLRYLNETQKRQCDESLKLYEAGAEATEPALLAPGSHRIIPLTPEQSAAMGKVYNKAWHVPQLPASGSGALRKDLDTEAVVREYHSTGAGLAVVDDVLTPEALALVRRACLESTVWYEAKKSYLKARLDDGLDQPVLRQIATELQAKLAPLLKGHGLQELWAYKYSEAEGLGVHADAAAVNANIWITEEDANLEPESGGLVVYHKAVAPAAFGYGDTYGWGGPYEAQQREVLEATGWANVTVKYRANRLVLFNSSLYHKTDRVRFKPGYEKRRINLTLLFGHARGQHSSAGWLQFA